MKKPAKTRQMLDEILVKIVKGLTAEPDPRRSTRPDNGSYKRLFYGIEVASMGVGT
jgi:hypothetical protein